MKDKLQKYLGLKLTLLLACTAFVSGGIALAKIPSLTAKQDDLAVTLTARKVAQPGSDKEQLLQADRAMPGEIIQYDAHYKNQGPDTMRNLAPMLPIPDGMVFLPSSAYPPLAEASLDGKTFQPVPILKEIILPNGDTRQVEVSPTEYRALRWRLGELKQGAQASVSARTQILGNPNP